MSSRPSRAGSDARFAGLLAVGAICVHQLRYLLGGGAAVGSAPHDQGHAYLATTLTPLLALACALVAGSLLRALLSGAAGTRRSLARTSIAFGLGLLLIFACQELLEGALAPGHAGGLGAPLAAGGWVAVPLTMALAPLLALLCGLLDRCERRLATVHAVRSVRRRAPISHGRPRRRAVTRLALELRTLAFGLSRRPPPQSAS